MPPVPVERAGAQALMFILSLFIRSQDHILSFLCPLMVRSADGLKVKALEALWHFSFIDWGWVGLLACWQLYVFCVCSCAPSMCVYDRSLLCRCGIWHLSSVWTFPTMMLPICLWHIQPTLIVCSSVCFSFSFFLKMSSQFYVLFWSPFPVLFQYDIVICHKTYFNL